MSLKLGFCFPKDLGLDPGSVSRRCHWLSLHLLSLHLLSLHLLSLHLLSLHLLSLHLLSLHLLSLHLLSLQPTMVGGITQKWINIRLQFCCSYNLQTYHRIYLRLISISFLDFQSFVRFMKSQFDVMSFLMKSPFSQNRIFNKK